MSLKTNKGKNTMKISENCTLFILKVKKVGTKITYHKKFLVGSSFDKWVKITHPNFLSSLNVNHRVTYEETFYGLKDTSETIYHVTYFKPEIKKLKVTLSDYTIIHAKTIDEALEKAFKLGQDIRFIE